MLGSHWGEKQAVNFDVNKNICYPYFTGRAYIFVIAKRGGPYDQTFIHLRFKYFSLMELWTGASENMQLITGFNWH